jgi:hypothetical protein
LLRSVDFILRHTLNSVYFGITLMVLTASYIAVGSGLPRVRAYFEMSDMEFFNAWPLKVLMVLLIMNLSVVTWIRIPFTPPRWGVWCVHCGIIVLVLGVMAHYANKVEGLTRIPVKATVEHYYDSAERALYARVGTNITQPAPLPTLPRFNTFSKESGNTDKLSRRELRDVQPVFAVRNPRSGDVEQHTLAEHLGVPLRIEIVEYFPYAHIESDYAVTGNGNETGILLEMTDPHDESKQRAWLVASDPRWAKSLAGVELAHRHLPHGIDAEMFADAVREIHRLDVTIGDFNDTLDVEIGQHYELADTGYTLEIESYQPAWPKFGTGEIVKAMTLKVTLDPAKAQVAGKPSAFRRMILNNDPLQTDFDLSAPDAGPMGKRQTEPLDKDLVLNYRMSDPFSLMPRQGVRKHTLVTTEAGGVIDVMTRVDGKGHSKHFADGVVKIEIDEGAAQRGPMQQAHGGHGHGAHDGHVYKIEARRHDGVGRVDRVVEVPPVQRDRDAATVGFYQVARVRLSSDNWSQELLVPYSQWALDDAWQAPAIRVPGAQRPLQLQLGNTARPLPAKITLEKFDLVPYPGGDNTRRSMMRDFKSTLWIEDVSGKIPPYTDVAHMNSPVYFSRGAWLFFQAQWDPEGQRFTVLGIGNRPFIGTMTMGCVMIFSGLLYAFYVKPIIIRRMKEQALAKALASGKVKGKDKHGDEKKELTPV